MVVRSSVELAAMEAVRAATAFLAADLAAAPKSCRKRPQTAIGIRGRLRASFSSASRRDGLSSLQDSATTEPRGMMTAWLTGERNLETLLHAQTLVQNAVRELGRAARRKQSLALDLTLPELKMLHAALGSQTNAYLEELYRCFRRLRLHMASCPAERKKQLDAMFESNHRFYSRADVAALLAKQQDTTNAMSPLSDREISMMMTHCDTQGTAQVDMRLFLELLQTVSSPRETLLGHVFRIVCPHAAVEKTSSQLRIFKLLALVKETATRHPDAAADVLQWLQSHASEATMSKHVWLSFHRIQSDQFEDDMEFLLYLDRVWNFIALGAKSTDVACASYAALLCKRDESSAASRTLVRMEKLQRELDSLVERITTTTHEFAKSSAQLEGITVPGHFLHLASSAVLEKASIALRHVQDLTIEPVASTIPKELHLPSLVRLDVAHVGLSALPDSLAELVHLKELKASHNQLTASSFPSSLRQWIHLTSVDLSANKLTAVPSVMEHWRALKQVDLSSNNIVKLPETLVWPHLTSLSIHDNHLVALPESLERCHALMELTCHRNALTRLPKALARLVHLKEATWHYNQLAMDHEDASWPSLERLVDIARFSLGHNCLRRLPAALTHLVGLQVCALGHNDLRDLSWVDFSTLIHCVEVDLRQNRLAHLPPSLFRMPKLSLLSVQGNVLVAIPDEVQGAPALLSLHANGNRISKLPRELNASLEHLDLSNNLIMTIPPTWASKRPRNQRHGALQTLKLNDNPLDGALQQVVDDQVYTARSTEQLYLAMVKLVDGVERSTSKAKVDFMTFQRGSARNRKEFDLKVRKGQAKQAVEFMEWSFRDVAKVVDCGMEYVAVASFQAVLTALGAPWTHYEWRRVLKAFQHPKKPLLDVERFLTALETLHDAKPATTSATMSFPAALFAFLERTAVEEVQRPHSQFLAPPPTIVSPPKPAISPVKGKKKDASRIAGRPQSSAPPTDVSRLRLKTLQDKWINHDFGQTPRKSAAKETKSTDLPVMDKAETPREEVIPMEMETPQPEESLMPLPPTTEEEKRQEDPV
ncbi:Leucine-rich repeat serine/threonine-protein kinase 1 [Aphanomyces cochlioides]|nr:Leucine-rich repeat serine/threonine-protein kinase 1 [Aphanomyces cochlioides]